jgi:hypothetical protein
MQIKQTYQIILSHAFIVYLLHSQIQKLHRTLPHPQPTHVIVWASQIQLSYLRAEKMSQSFSSRNSVLLFVYFCFVLD